MQKSKLFDFVLLSLFAAIIILLAFTPAGYIMIPGIAITTVHIPVIIGSYVFGVKGGSLLGLVFGLTSLIRAIMTPDALATVILGTGVAWYTIFLAVMILIVPRVLVGVFSALSFKAIKKFDRTDFLAIGVSSFIGSLTNTIFVLCGLYLFAFERAAAVGFGMENPTYGAFAKLLFTVVTTNGMLEAAAAVVICVVVGKAVLKILESRKGILQ